MHYTTTRCSAHGHPEITLLFKERRPVPVERMLLGYFEQSVSAGKRFLPGQTVQLGWATLRLCARADGTLGVEERVGTGWAESCDRSLMQVWFQKEVASSVGLAERISFPRQDQTAMAAECALHATSVLLVRQEPEAGDETFSGWSIACTEEHDHGHRHFPTLLQLAESLPYVTQFLALPVASGVLVVGPNRIRAHVYFDGKEVAPHPRSYLAALNDGRV